MSAAAEQATDILQNTYLRAVSAAKDYNSTLARNGA